MEDAVRIPNGLPTLSAGKHFPGDGEACVMEYVSVITGHEFTDQPECTNPIIAAAARQLNDYMKDEHRHLLVPLIGRLTTAYERSREVTIALGRTASDLPTMGSAADVTRWVEHKMAWTICPEAPSGQGLLDYDPQAGVAYLTKLLDIHEAITQRPVTPISPEALDRARQLIQSGAV